MPATPRTPDIETAAMLLESIPSLMRSIREEFSSVSDSKVSIGQFRVMCMLREEPQTNGELASATGVAAPTMSRLIDAFETRGLVERRKSKADRRQQSLVLTTQGRRETDRIREAIRLRMAARIARLPENRRKTLFDGLKVLEELFENDPGKGRSH